VFCFYFIIIDENFPYPILYLYPLTAEDMPETKDAPASILSHFCRNHFKAQAAGRRINHRLRAGRMPTLRACATEFTLDRR